MNEIEFLNKKFDLTDYYSNAIEGLNYLLNLPENKYLYSECKNLDRCKFVKDSFRIVIPKEDIYRFRIEVIFNLIYEEDVLGYYRYIESNTGEFVDDFLHFYE